jgi:hypothetical protein
MEKLGGRCGFFRALVAPDPEEAFQIDAVGRGGLGVEGVGSVEPGAYMAGLGEGSRIGQRERGAAGGFWADQLRDRADYETSV